MSMKNIFCVVLLLGLFISCKKEEKLPAIDNAVDLDGTLINDSSLVFPERFLLSSVIPSPTAADLSKPVLIAVHGFTATTFEWIEMRDYAKKEGTFLTSLVLLGGHGRDYADFKSATWATWKQPIIDEYTKLRALGYTNINFVASSTGCPLVLEAIYSAKLEMDVLNDVFFIDPILVPANKTLSIIKVVGPLLKFSATTMEAGENGFWYKYRPYEALDQLNTLVKKVRKIVEHGVVLPGKVHLTVYKSNQDGAADPISASILYKGVKHNDGSEIDVSVEKSNLHVFTRLKGRNTITDADVQLQQKVFLTIKKAL